MKSTNGIVGATLVVKWEDGGTHEMTLDHASGLRVQRVRRPRRPWRRRERNDLVLTFIDAGPGGTFAAAPDAPETVEPDSDKARSWAAHTDTLPREDRRQVA